MTMLRTSTRLLAVNILLHGLLLSVPATAQTPICNLADSLDPDIEVAASPRENYNAEFFALAGSDGVAASALMYNFILEDFAAIEAIAPGVTDLRSMPFPLPDGFFASFVSGEARDRAENGEIPEFECLNELFDLSHSNYYSFNETSAFFGFDGLYDTLVMRELYESLPEIASTSPNSSIVPRHGCYYSPDGERRIYFFEEVVIFFPAIGIVRWIRAEVSDSGIILDQIENDLPPWHGESEACLAGDFDGTINGLVSGAIDIPTTSDLGLLALIGFLVAAASRRLRMTI